MVDGTPVKRRRGNAETNEGGSESEKVKRHAILFIYFIFILDFKWFLVLEEVDWDHYTLIF